MDVIDCNNHVKSAIKYFGPSCAVNSLIDKYNPIGMCILMYIFFLFHLSLALAWKVTILRFLVIFPGHFRQSRS